MAILNPNLIQIRQTGTLSNYAGITAWAFTNASGSISKWSCICDRLIILMRGICSASTSSITAGDFVQVDVPSDILSSIEVVKSTAVCSFIKVNIEGNSALQDFSDKIRVNKRSTGLFLTATETITNTNNSWADIVIQVEILLNY